MNLATSEDFIDLFGKLEAIELSNIDDSTEESILKRRIDQALGLAYDEIMSYESLCETVAGQIAIRKVIKGLMLDIARYRLDTLERREDIQYAYEKALEFLKLAGENKNNQVDLTVDELAELGLKETAGAGRKPYFKTGRRVWNEEDSHLTYFRNQKLQ